MVKLHIKRGDDSLFLFEANLESSVGDVLNPVTAIYNGRLKIERICSEIEELAKHGTMFPPEIMGLTDEQVIELKLVDEWGDRCIPSGGYLYNKDTIGRRNGRQPTKNMQEVLKKAICEAKEMISKNLVLRDECLTQKIIQTAINNLKGAVTIVYPMKLPPHDIIRQELENTEDLTGTQASLEVIEPALARLWFCGKEMEPEKRLVDYIGKNDKCKVILKLQKKGQGPPGREPIINEEQKKVMMMQAYRRQEELKKLAENEDDDYLNSQWADTGNLKRSFQGLDNISWKYK